MHRAEVPLQPSLLDDGAPRADPGFAGLRRLTLDDHSWVDHCPGWLTGGDELFALLAGQARWEQRTVRMWGHVGPEPRLTATWSDDDAPPPLRALCPPLSHRYGVPLDRVWVNLYRDGADGVAWHGDRTRRVMTEPLVATVSLGERRRFLLRPRGGGPAVHELRPGHGDLLVMGGRCQHDWEHTVPKTARSVGPRMAVTIRHSRPAPGQRWLAVSSVGVEPTLSRV